jgi:hypothetical protein
MLLVKKVPLFFKIFGMFYDDIMDHFMNNYVLVQ